MKHKVYYSKDWPDYPDVLVTDDHGNSYLVDYIQRGETVEDFVDGCADSDEEASPYNNYVIKHFDEIQKDIQINYIKENL